MGEKYQIEISVYIPTFLFIYTHIFIYTGTYSVYIYISKSWCTSEACSQEVLHKYVPVLINSVGLQALRETEVSPHEKVICVPPNLPKVPWISVPSVQKRTWEGGSSLTQHRSPPSFCVYFYFYPLFARCSPWLPHEKHTVFAEWSRWGGCLNKNV